jgi:hypothetical protein
MSWKTEPAHYLSRARAVFHSGPLMVLIGALAVACGQGAALADGVSFTLTPGAGHDRFTETFYLDDSSAVSLDSLARIKQTEDGLRESYGSLGLGVDYADWHLTSTTYATDAAWRSISYAAGRWMAGRWRTDVSGRLEWKGIDSDDSLATAYTYYRVDVKPRYQLNDTWSAVMRADWENTDYNRNNSYTVDYHRLRAQAGMTFLGDALQHADAYVGIAQRTAPDSAQLNYTEAFVRLDAGGWYWGQWRFSGDCSFADRDYDAPADEDDHRRWSLRARGSLDWTDLWRFSVLGEWQLWDYVAESEAVYDVSDWRFEGSARARLVDEWEFGGLVEARFENPTGTFAEDNAYQQWGAGPILFWNPSWRVWCEVLQRIGYRNYDAASLIYDDYTFWELSGQFDLALSAGPNISVTASYISESHEDPLRDFDQLYLSLALRIPIQP